MFTIITSRFGRNASCRRRVQLRLGQYRKPRKESCLAHESSLPPQFGCVFLAGVCVCFPFRVDGPLKSPLDLLQCSSHKCCITSSDSVHTLFRLWGVGSLQLYLYFEVRTQTADNESNNYENPPITEMLEARPELAQVLHFHDMGTRHGASGPYPVNRLYIFCEGDCGSGTNTPVSKVSLNSKESFIADECSIGLRFTLQFSLLSSTSWCSLCSFAGLGIVSIFPFLRVLRPGDKFASRSQ